jgi:murein L,D-transpeptidase YafK
MKMLFAFLLFGLMKVQAQVSDVVHSSRSIEAVERVKSLLEKELTQKKLALGSPIFIRIIKENKLLEVFVKQKTQYHLFKTYKICYFSGNIGPKTKEGDNQAPEGFYKIKPAQMNPNSDYHLAFNLGYPNDYDLAHGYTGSYLMVHGDCVSIGCYAMTNEKIEEIYALMQAAFENGQDSIAVHCFPFEMTRQKLNDYKKNKHYDFWKNLAIGYQLFVQNHQPPKVNVKGLKYVFE